MDRIKLKVFGLSYQSMSQTGAYALILAEENDAFRIPIIIGIAEAQSIAIQMEHLHSQRPLTHDLMKSLADNLGVVLEEVYIYRWESGIFYSELRFRNGEESLKIDSRTSDAIALALILLFAFSSSAGRITYALPGKRTTFFRPKANNMDNEIFL